MKRNKKGTNILTENIIFLVLNIVFLSILILFLFSKMNSVAVLEEEYAKQIALLIDSAKPGMEISLDMTNAIEKAEGEKWEGKIISIHDNIVTVRLRDKEGYSYSFFNDVELNKLYFYPKERGSFEFIVESYK